MKIIIYLNKRGKLEKEKILDEINEIKIRYRLKIQFISGTKWYRRATTSTFDIKSLISKAFDIKGGGRGA